VIWLQIHVSDLMILKKGLATKSVILLILGIIVLAIVIYLVYQSFLTSSSFSLESCKNFVVEACQQCIFATTNVPCKLKSDQLSCARELSKVGIIVSSSGEFDISECYKLGYR
jgi:hypothetical protein